MNDHDIKLVNPGLGNLIASHPYSTNQAPAAPSLEQLEKDAARYRFLRLHTLLRDRGYGPSGRWLEIAEHAVIGWDEMLDSKESTIDAAIDAAMKE